jgi:hypothetical protein
MSQKFVCSFLAFEVLFYDILGLRFFVIVLKHHIAATKHFVGLTLSISLAEAYPFP